MDQQRQSVRMVFVLLVSAVFCGIATYLVIVFFLNRTSKPFSAVRVTALAEVASGNSVSLESDEARWGLLGSEPVVAVEPVNTPLADKLEQNYVTDVTIVALPTSSTMPSEIVQVEYRVQPGDTLYSISQVQNTSIDLLAIYGISSADLIAGSVISLPIPNPAFCPAMFPYVVREGDTVFSIAQRFDTTIEAIASDNHLDSAYTIRTAEILCVP